MKIYRLIKLTVCLSALLCSLCYASGEEGTMTYKITRFDPSDHPPPEFRIGNKKKGTLVKVPLTHIAGPLTAKLRDGKHLDFWGKDEEKPQITLTIGKHEREGLLLVLAPKREGSFSILKINALQNKLKGGERYIINATSNQLEITIAGSPPIVVQPKKAKILNAPPVKDVSSVIIKEKQKDTWNLVASEDWHFDKRFRKYLFIYRSSKSKGLLFHGVSERL